MSYIYGPVPSRRLGQSLGVDPIPFKTCNFNCIYCQLGRTTPMTNERRDFFPPEDILAQVKSTLVGHTSDDVDHVTIVGEGEPTLCASLGLLIRGIKAITAIPVAVITNGALLSTPQVREELLPANVVIPTLDAADEITFRHINRPWPSLHITDIIEGMVAFRQQFNGQLWVEVMLIKDLNDGETVLFDLAAALHRIQPDQIHLNAPIRPPAEAWVAPPDDDGMVRAQAILGEVAPIFTFAEGDFRLDDGLQVTEAIIEIIRRHPMRETKLVATLDSYGLTSEQVQSTLAALEANGRARRHFYRGQVFWEYGGGRFGQDTKLRETS
jgi:wyosine [tRNA(Phe)-imidazoG37] synthetase (radical SAM superfamily)